MRLLFPVFLACLVSTGAYAQDASIPKGISGYRDIDVAFSENAEKCNLKDAQMFKDHLRAKMAEAGVAQRDDIYSYLGLSISGKKFGIIGGHCVTSVSVNPGRTA